MTMSLIPSMMTVPIRLSCLDDWLLNVLIPGVVILYFSDVGSMQHASNALILELQEVLVLVFGLRPESV